MLNYLREHKEEIYPSLEEKGKKIREGIKKAFDSEGVDVVVTGTGSLFQTHFPFEKGKTFDSPQSINKWTDIEKREIEFRLRMLAKGVHIMHGGGSLSITHSDEDLEKIINATNEVAKEMRG